MQYEVLEDPEVEFTERLRMEIGWGDVAKGLGQVLIGYGALFLGVASGLGLVLIALYGLGDDIVKKGAKPSNVTLWQLYLGLGILSVIGLISYTIIVGGQFKCMMYAPERNGTRWFMFLCIACLFLGPAFELASGIASWQTVQELKKNPGRLQEFHLNPMGHWLHLVAFGISMLYPLCFTLFLRAIAVSLRSRVHVILVNIFLAFKAILVAGTAYLLYKHPPGGLPIPLEQALVIAAAWGVLLLIYVGLIAATRGCINSVMSQVRSPLEM